MTLGLLRETVALAQHSSEWQREFAAEATRLRSVLAEWSCVIEHIGSTAVSGLVAKPILDIAVGARSVFDVSELRSALESLGYEYRGDAKDEGGHVFVKESQPGMRTHHVHVVQFGSSQWNAYLTLREWLRSNSSARSAYQEAKLALAAMHHNNRRAYTASKAVIISSLLVDAGLGV